MHNIFQINLSILLGPFFGHSSSTHPVCSMQVDSIVRRNMVRVLKQDFNIAINVCGMKNRILIHLLEAEIWQTIPNYCTYRMVFSLLDQKRTHIFRKHTHMLSLSLSLWFTYWRQHNIIYDDDSSSGNGNQRMRRFCRAIPAAGIYFMSHINL